MENLQFNFTEDALLNRIPVTAFMRMIVMAENRDWHMPSIQVNAIVEETDVICAGSKSFTVLLSCGFSNVELNETRSAKFYYELKDGSTFNTSFEESKQAIKFINFLMDNSTKVVYHNKSK